MLSSGPAWSRRLRLLSTITSLTSLERQGSHTRPGGLAANHNPARSRPISISRRFTDILVRLCSIVLQTKQTCSDVSLRDDFVRFRSTSLVSRSHPGPFLIEV